MIAVLLLALASSSTWAATCATTVTGNDALRFNTATITVPKTCSSFTITLKNTGSMPRSVMGHNVVIAAATAEQAVINDGAKAGLDHDYVKPNDADVIASTKLIGGGEQADTTFKVSALKAGVPYAFFCTCPGHASLMHGTVELK